MRNILTVHTSVAVATRTTGGLVVVRVSVAAPDSPLARDRIVDEVKVGAENDNRVLVHGCTQSAEVNRKFEIERSPCVFQRVENLPTWNLLHAWEAFS